VAHEDYSCIAGKKFALYFEGYFEIFAIFQKYLFIFTISERAPNNVLRSPRWETLA